MKHSALPCVLTPTGIAEAYFRSIAQEPVKSAAHMRALNRLPFMPRQMGRVDRLCSSYSIRLPILILTLVLAFALTHCHCLSLLLTSIYNTDLNFTSKSFLKIHICTGMKIALCNSYANLFCQRKSFLRSGFIPDKPHALQGAVWKLPSG